jgi:hypothetical protein
MVRFRLCPGKGIDQPDDGRIERHLALPQLRASEIEAPFSQGPTPNQATFERASPMDRHLL